MRITIAKEMGRALQPNRHSTLSTSEELKSRAKTLHHLLIRGKVQGVKELLERSDVIALFDAYRKHFHMSVACSAVSSWCCKKSDPSAVVSSESMQAILQELVNAGIDINESEFDCCHIKTNLILVAIQRKNLNLCEMLLRLGASINFCYKDNNPFYATCAGTTALNQAVFAGPEFVEFFLQHNAKPNDDDDVCAPSSAVNKAVWNTNPEAVKLLMNWYLEHDRLFPWQQALHQLLEPIQPGENRTVTDKRNEETIIAILQMEYHLNESPTRVSEYFHGAASRGLEKVMLLLLGQEPMVLQSGWLVNNEIPPSLQTEEHSDFVDWLKETRSQPLRLQLLCRAEILRTLGPRPEERVNRLPLPKIMKKYLMDKDVMELFS